VTKTTLLPAAIVTDIFIFEHPFPPRASVDDSAPRMTTSKKKSTPPSSPKADLSQTKQRAIVQKASSLQLGV
jgi:hypothetical protein